jgi:hypothetical protein
MKRQLIVCPWFVPDLPFDMEEGIRRAELVNFTGCMWRTFH